MFDRIKNRWREAREINLKKEVLDSISRLHRLPEEVNLRAADTLATTYHYLSKEAGPLENISNKGKLEISKMLNSKGREAFKMDMGRGYGFFILSMHYESSSLPGQDAKFVHKITNELLENAIDVSKEIDGKTKDNHTST